MTAKEYVKQHYPSARAEKQVTNAHEVYWLIRPKSGEMYMADGKSESNAWVNAKKKILERIQITK